VTKDQVKVNKYDLSASHYRQIEQDEVFYEEPTVTLERLRQIDVLMCGVMKELENGLK